MVHRSRTLRLLGASSLFFTPVAAQFGVAGGRKKAGTSFEEINQLAKEKMAGGGGGLDMGALGDMANMDMGQLTKMMQDAMNDPEMMEMMNKMGGDMNSAMKEMAQMDPEQLMTQVQDSLKMLTDGDMVETILGQKEEVLKTLEANNLMSAAEIEEMRNNPEKFEAQMRDAFGKMKDVFSDPDSLDAAMKMMKGFQDVMSDPEKAMKELAAAMKTELSDDDKIEEARLQLLANPELAGNPALSAMFGSDEMKDILNDPVKWRESVKKGQGMLLGADGPGVGEL